VSAARRNAKGIAEKYRAVIEGLHLKDEIGRPRAGKVEHGAPEAKAFSFTH
jgi:hypothetical protein